MPRAGQVRELFLALGCLALLGGFYYGFMGALHVLGRALGLRDSVGMESVVGLALAVATVFVLFSIGLWLFRLVAITVRDRWDRTS